MLKILVLVIAALTLLIWQVWPMIYQASVTSMWSIGEGTTQQISLSDMKKIETSEGIIYYEAGQEQVAQDIAEILFRSRRLIRQHLGIDPHLPSIVLVPQQPGVGSVILKGIIAIPLMVPPDMKSLRDADAITDLFVYWVVPHESVELVIAPILYHDRSSRWIGDGLAQYAGYLVAQELFPQGLERFMRGEYQRVEALLAQGNSVYDLTREFLVRRAESENLLSPRNPEEWAGYAVSLALWLDIARRYGEEVIRELWHRVSQLSRCVLYVICLSRPTAKDAARILSELTGEDIWHRIQSMDLQKVLEILKAADSRSFPSEAP